jgi:hypothetical protein
LAKSAVGNPYGQHPVTGAQHGQYDALVVNINDPEKTGRIQCRIEGHMDSMDISDDKLPWMQCAGSNMLPNSLTATGTHGLMPGSMVQVQGHGQHFTVMHPMGNDRKDAGRSTHPSMGEGKDTVFAADEFKNGTHGYDQKLDDVKKNKTTDGARKLRDGQRNQKRSKEPIKESTDEHEIPPWYA